MIRDRSSLIGAARSSEPAATLVDGTATWATASLTPGTHTVTARYTGPDPGYTGSTSPGITQTVTASG